MFVTEGDRGAVYKCIPKSDLVVIDESSGLPILICEVDSNIAKRDRVRMVFQGVVACRQWRFVLPESLKDQNRVLGLFVHADFVVDLFLFHVAKKDHGTGKDDDVCSINPLCQSIADPRLGHRFCSNLRAGRASTCS